jgi:hypothetical protein
MSTVVEFWSRHSATALRSPSGYIIERTTYPGGPVDTVFICWSPAGKVIGGSSGTGISAAAAKQLCADHEARSRT